MSDPFIVKDARIERHSEKDRFRLTFTSERDEVAAVTLRASHIIQFAELVLAEIGLDQIPTTDPQSLKPRQVYRIESFHVKPAPNGPVLQFYVEFHDGSMGVLPFSFSDEEATEVIEMLKRGINQGG